MRRVCFALALAFGVALLVAVPASATAFTASPWAYACGATHYGNPATATAAGCVEGGGTAEAAYTAGTLTLSKNGATSQDLAAGATIGGLVTLSAASWDLGPESYCGAGAPRLNVTTKDGKTHFFGCAANNHDGHVSLDLSAAGDGSGNGGVGPQDEVTEIDIVQDEQGTAILQNLSFSGTAAPAPTPSASSSATPAPSGTAAPTPAPTHVAGLAQTGAGRDIWPNVLLGGLLVLLGLASFVLYRRLPGRR